MAKPNKNRAKPTYDAGASMDSRGIDLTKLFDADAYRQSGKCPWTFFAYPTALANSPDLPLDDNVMRLLGTLQDRGITLGVWLDPVANGTNYIACPVHQREQLGDALQLLEQEGVIERDFLVERCERLFASLVHNKESERE